MSHDAFMKGDPHERTNEDFLNLASRYTNTGQKPSHVELVGARLTAPEFYKLAYEYQSEKPRAGMAATPDLFKPFGLGRPIQTDLQPLMEHPVYGLRQDQKATMERLMELYQKTSQFGFGQ